MRSSFLKISTIFLLFISTILNAQFSKNEVKEGNELYSEKKYDEAEIKYSNYLNEEEAENPEIAQFNLGNALYKQERFDEAAKEFAKVATTVEEKNIQAQAFHNLGNALAKQEKWKEAANSYKSALKLNPRDDETRYNLAQTLARIKKQEQQQNQNDEKIKPSEFAKKLKAQADVLVAQSQFSKAFTLMQNGLQEDQTVAYYNSFIKRLKDVSEIESTF